MRHSNLWLGLLLTPLTLQAAPPLTLPWVNLLSNPSFEWDQEVGHWVVQAGYAFGWGLWGQDDVYGVYSARSVPSFAAGAVEGVRAQQIVWQSDGTTLLHVNQDVRQIKPSELVGQDAARGLSQKLAGAKPSGTELLWVENGE